MGYENFEAKVPDSHPEQKPFADAPAYVEAFERLGSGNLISNVQAEMTIGQAGLHELPVSINHGDRGGSYVSLPHSAYILYGREELDLIDLGWMKQPAKVLIDIADHLVEAIGVNHVVQIDNWLLSTNLHGKWRGEGIGALRATLTERFPGHFLAVRSVDHWSCPTLAEKLKSDGWVLLPSRQIWVTDDMERDWYARNNVKNDRRALRRSGLQISDVNRLNEADAERVAELYRMLYIEKYSALNPNYSAKWMQLALQTGLLKMRLARNEEGVILAAAGIVARDGIATNPMLGYDTSKSQSDGLYRIACYLFGEFARDHRLRVNGSAGAAHFKKLRGAHSEIEYTAFYVEHLPSWKRYSIKAAARLMETMVVPVMKKRML